MLEVADIVESIRMIEHHKGKYIKVVLSYLEQRGLVDKEIRKIILDAFNNYSRAVQRDLGYQIEE